MSSTELQREPPEDAPSAPESASSVPESAAPTIPITRPWLGAEEVARATAVIESGWVTQGSRVEEFEQRFAHRCGAEYGVAVSNCTAALHLGLLALGVGPGDEVICPSMSFIATANAIRHAGAEPHFVEVDPRTFNIDPAAIEAAISERTKAVMPVHQIGLPCDLDAVSEIARRHTLPVLEDAACAIGSEYRGRPIGSHGHASCFSLHPRKVITTGEGGMITTDDEALAHRLRLLRQHGMSISDRVRHGSKRVVREEYVCVGFNYRMTDLQAALGLAQLDRLDAILERRRAIALRYDEALEHHPVVEPPHVPEGLRPNYQSYAVRLREGAKLEREVVMQRLLDAGIATRTGIMLAHREPPYREGNWSLPLSEDASDRSFLLPLFPQMSEAEVDTVIRALFAVAD